MVGVPIVSWSHGKAHSWQKLFSAGSGYVFADISLSAILDNLAKFGLYYFLPVYLALFRIGGVFLLCCIFFRVSWKEIPRGGLWLSVLPSIMFGIAAIARLTSFAVVGVQLTLLVMLLKPGLVYLLSRLMLKEKLEWRPIIGNIFVIGLIGAVLVLS